MSQNRSHPNPPGGAQPALHRIVDQQHQGIVVATFEHPRDWPARSQVVWNFNDSANPVQVYASTFNQRGTEALEFLPTEACFWLPPPNFMFTQGHKHRGSTFLPPLSAPDALTRFAIPKYRGDRQNLRLVYVQPVPDLAQMLGLDSLRNVRHEGVMARVEYNERGRPFEEEFYACVIWHPPNGQQTNWGLIDPRCFRAARGQLDAARQKLWNIVTSVRNNPQWGQVFNQVVQQLHGQFLESHQADEARRAGEKRWGEELREYREWQSNLHQQQTNERWASQERINEKRGDVLAGRERYHDPGSAYGNPHFDYDYSQAVWTNGSEWIHSQSAGFDPNTDPRTSSRGPWHLARRT